MAVASGLRQEIMKPPAMIFHLEHDHSWVVIRPEDRLRRFVDRPWLDGWTLREIAWRMLSSSVPIEYNAPDWGLGNVPLREVRVCSGVRHLVEVPAPVQPVVEANSPGPPSVHR
jgi:hypothetical protein